MPLNLASPGVVVREVDLTIGRIDPTSASIGAIAGPYARGPINVPVLVQNEEELRQNFGDPYSTDKHYEHWMTASSFLAYGGSLRVVRTDGSQLTNAKYGDATSIKINSPEDYINKGYDDSTIGNVVVAAKDPGSWANGIKVALIDGLADQVLTLNTVTDVTVGLGVSQAVPDGTIKIGAGTTSLLDGYFKGIVTDVDGERVSIKFVSHVSAAGTETAIDYAPRGSYKFSTGSTVRFTGAGIGSTAFVGVRGSLSSTAASHSSGDLMSSYYLVSSPTLDMPGGINLSASATSLGISTTGISTGADRFLLVDNEIISLAAATIGSGELTGVIRGQAGTAATSHVDGSSVKYLQLFDSVASVPGNINSSTTTIGINTTRVGLSTIFNAGGVVKIGSEFVSVSAFLTGQSLTRSVLSENDWFDQQTFEIGSNPNVTRRWSSIAPRPQTTNYASSRNSRFDEVHIIVIDATGSISGNEGTVLEKHLGLSKAKDALFSAGSPSYWREYLSKNSRYIFGGGQPSTGVEAAGFSSGFTVAADIDWDQDAEGTLFGCVGALNMPLSGGSNYNGSTNTTSTGAFSSQLSDLSNSYEILKNKEEYDIDFLLMGSSNYTMQESQALASKLIDVAEDRKDAVAFITPHRSAFLNDSVVGEEVNSPSVITNNIIEFYSPIPSSSYAVFDSGYKYMYDRFNRTFRYVPLNGDMAGLCARNDANNFPWFSPAGTVRGSILNAIKLAYNPTQSQRDVLYSNRVNPIIFSPGGGIVLFGDKTGLSKASAFDRINVRRLFIYLENAIGNAAKDQLFEFNDEITRNNFLNIVEPFLRDVQAKRGIQDFRVICDETNNTAAVLDNNEFVADIFVKPTRSINYIGLTFVATRTGVSFEEVIGNV